MSFMFHPYPYVDPDAVNPIHAPESVKNGLVKGPQSVAKEIARQIKAGKTRVGIDCYAGAEIGALARQLEEFVENVRLIDATTLAMDEKELDEKLAPYLPTDRDRDPVLLYGRRFLEGYEGLQNAEKVQALKEKLDKADGPVVVYGMGALCKALRESYDLKVWMDLSPRQTAINYKTGLAINYGSTHSRPFSQLMRRNYYVDFETALDLRWELIREKALDGYIFADDPQKMQWLPYVALLDRFDELNRSPMRCRPVYLEGVWGGFYVHKLRKLPKEMKNCAWVFDMIPMEVSLAATFDGNEFEVPFYTFVQAMGEKLLGKRAYDAFGGYFPIRFNYDDTYHANGNMSIQCHPDAEYVMKNHSELGRQDESYYVCVTAQDAKTYLGFQNEDSCEKFFAAAEKAQETHELIDYTQYINAVPSVPGTQVMIPAGTVHASGRNQVILEIGSLTVGSYTYKLYDYQRIDPQTGLPRPIHLKMGRDVIHPERTAEFVRDNLVNHGGVVRQGEDWCEKVVGEHDLLYFSLRNLVFATSMEDDTRDDFHVLALVDGKTPMIVEIKYHDRIAQTCEAAYEQLRRYKGAYCVESFHPLAVQWFRQHAPEVVRGELASGGKWKPGELNRFEHFAMKYLLPLCLTRPHFVAYCAAEDGNLSMWLEKKLFRPYLAAWTIRDQKLMDRVQKEYDYPIFELFTPKEKQ